MNPVPATEIPRADIAAGRAGVLERNLSALDVRGALPAALGEGGLPGVLLPPGDVEQERRAAAAARLPFSADPSRPPKGVIVAGLRSPWILLRVLESAGRQADGYTPPVYVIEPDAREAVRGLGAADVSAALAQERLKLFVGERAVEDFRGALLARLDYALPDFVVQTPGSSVGVATSAAEAARAANEAQQRGHVELEARMRGVYEPRDLNWWRGRYGEAFGGGRPLRVLLPVSRYSTFVRHAAADLAAALEGIGHEARILSEPDDSSKLVTLAYLRQFAEWTPDLVVLINYARRHMANAVPANVPFVCWVQDRMPQLFDEAVGRSQGALDFVIGHLHTELFTQFGYPLDERRVRFRFVPASARKFHPAPVPARPELECDVAYISHQSETVEAAKARLMAAFGGNATLIRAAERMYARLRERMQDAERPFDPIVDPRLAMVQEALAAEGVANPDLRLSGAILSNFVIPIAERMWRHGMLEWAARLCERSGWRLALFGSGWERHPTLARYARPALGHGEELRTVYQRAGACLHASLTTNAHQRVFECALSDGLMLRRGPSPDREIGRHALWNWVMRTHAPVERTAEGADRYEVREGEELDPRALLALDGLPAEAGRPWSIEITEARRKRVSGVWRLVDVRDLPDYALPRAWETMFASEAELEGALERALHDAEWRRATIEAHGAYARARHSHDALAADLLGMARGALVQGAGAGAA